MSTSYEEQLREQLHATTPTPYAGLDPAAVIGAGERVVRRRRIGTALVAAVAVAVVAVGGQLLTTGRPDAAPVPAQTPATATGSATLTIAGSANTGSGDHTYVVSVRPGDDKGVLVDYAEKTASGTRSMGGTGIDPADPRITWGHGGDSPVVIGVIPSASAQHRIVLTTAGDFGGYSTDVQPIVGTDYSAFVAYYDKPLTGDAPIANALWFDAGGRPVDESGAVGTATTLAGKGVWLTRDGARMGLRSGSTDAATPAPGPGVDTTYPHIEMSDTGTEWTVAVRLRPEAVSAELVFRDGSRRPVTPTRLGQWGVAITTVTTTGTDGPGLTRVQWKSASGVEHDDLVPALG